MREPLVVEAGETKPGFAATDVPGPDDDRLVQGQGAFLDDLRRPGLGHVHFVRSPHAHARIRSVDVAPALELAGVYGALTGDEAAALTDPFGRDTAIREYALAAGKVRFAGEPVAAVVAATAELAREAAELVAVEYEPLAALVDARLALDAGAPILHDEAGSNLVGKDVFERGDWAAALAESDHVVTISELHCDRLPAAALERAGCLVEYDREAGQWTLYGDRDLPAAGKCWIAPALRCGIDRLRFVQLDGDPACQHPVHVVCCLLARKLDRPVRWAGEHTSHGGERWFRDVEVAVQSDGTLLGFRCRALEDCGAFPRSEPAGWLPVTPGCYRWRNVRIDCTRVVTNTAPVGGSPGLQHQWLIERIVDIVGRELGLDPVAIRKRNYVREFPWTTPDGSVYDSGDYARSLDVALDLIGPIGDRRRDAESRGRLLGLGIGSALEPGRTPDGAATATVQLDIFGDVVVTPGAVPPGQEAAVARLVSDILGCAPDDVIVRAGPRAYAGLAAVQTAAEQLAAEIGTVAAAVFGVLPEALPFLGIGALVHANDPLLPQEVRDTVALTGRSAHVALTYASQIHVCVVEVDPETGGYEIVDHALVVDCGTRLRPGVTEVRAQGAAARAIGAVYDLPVPRALDLPALKTGYVESPSPFTPLGAKEPDESGGAALHAVCSALQDALGPLGGPIVHDSRNPPSRVWELIADPEASRARVSVESRA